jgi:hypothetical protein
MCVQTALNALKSPEFGSLGLLACAAVVLVSQEFLFYRSVVGEPVVWPRGFRAPLA